MSLAIMKARLEHQGGQVRQDRMIRDKLNSMLAATRNSYQAAKFLKYPGFEEQSIGLFNPINITERHDTKMMSVPFEAGYKVGDVFRWVNTDTVWIIFLQEYTELAYFRGECRRCDHEIHWVDKNQQKQSTYVSIMGPSNPSLRSIAATLHSIATDHHTSSIRVLVSATERNLLFFHRYQEFLLQGTTYEIQNLDTLSMPGIIQLYATEKATNLIDDDVEENIRNAFNVLPVIDRHPTDFMIEGPPRFKPFEEVTYTVLAAGGTWFIEENHNRKPNEKLPVTILNSDSRSVTLKWDFVKSGNFTLAYRMENGHIHKRHLIVGSLM